LLKLPEVRTIKLTCDNGRFFRGDDGIWLYGPDGMPVRGGRDMTLTNFFNFEQAETDNGPVVRVPRGLLLENYLLEFCAEYDTGGPFVDVPAGVWAEHDQVIGIWAPELQHEGGVRGIRLDKPRQPGDPVDPWEPPLAPNRPSSDPYKPISEMETDIRRRTSWGFAPLKGLVSLERYRRKSSERMVD
jgi:hypothetical protein